MSLAWTIRKYSFKVQRRSGRRYLTYDTALVQEALGSVLEAGRKSDTQTVAMASGKANVMDVVTAVAETDVAVSTLVSVRDRVIQSYEDIMKMTI